MDESEQEPKQYKVLSVEDDEMLRELLKTKLTREKFSVFDCTEHKAAFAYLEKEKPDIILLDLLLPGMDGFEILTKLKADDKYKDIPVLILSNFSQQTDIDRAMALGAAGFMVKANFTLNEVVDRVKKVLAEQGAGV